MVGRTTTPLESRHRKRLPAQRLEVAQDRARSGRTNSIPATVVNKPKITSAGSNPGSLPGSGSGIVGAATDGPTKSHDPETEKIAEKRCLRMTQPIRSVRLGGPYRIWLPESFAERAQLSSRSVERQVRDHQTLLSRA